MADAYWIAAVRLAGIGHLVTLVCAHFTPIPRDWEHNLSRLPDVHRRFALAQNVFIGGTIAFCGMVSLLLARDLVAGSPSARALCAGIALWWGGRLAVLPWLRVWPELGTCTMRLGFALLHLECAAYGVGYLWLAVR